MFSFKMPKIEGKTINELVRATDVTGTEIVPMSVYDDTLNAYVTRGITIDDFFKTIYNMIQHAEDGISYTNAYMNSYVDELRATDDILYRNDELLNSELTKTNTYVSYNAEGNVKLHSDFHNVVSYTYTNVAYISETVDSVASYVNSEITDVRHDMDDVIEKTNDVINRTEVLSSYIEENTQSIIENKESINDTNERITYVQSYIESEISIAYTKLDDHIAYLAAYIEAGDGEIAKRIDNIQAYTYENVGSLSYSQLGQDITLAQHASAISKLAEISAYNSYVNTIQSGRINTIYFENSDDAFNNWLDPDDDNVRPQN